MAKGHKPGRKRVRKNIPNGIAHVRSTFNNTIVTISDMAGTPRRRRQGQGPRQRSRGGDPLAQRRGAEDHGDPRRDPRATQWVSAPQEAPRVNAHVLPFEI